MTDTALIRGIAADILESPSNDARTIQEAVYRAAGNAAGYEATMREIRAESWTAPGMTYIDGLDIWAGIPIRAGFEHLVAPVFLVAALREPPTVLDRVRAEASRNLRSSAG
jgi:hypothetical protein